MASSITGGLGRTESGTLTVATEEQTRTQTQEQQQRQETAEESQLSQLVSSLDEETLGGLQAFVQQLLGGAGGEAAPGSAQELAQLISGRAQTGGAGREEETQAIVGEARRKGAGQLEKIQQQLARQSGGSLANTLVAASTGEAAISLESQLAELEAKLGIEQRQAQTAELAQAFQSLVGGEQAGTQELTSLLGILKGAQVGTEQVAGRTTTQITDLQSLIEELTTGTTTTSGTTRGSSAGLGFEGSNL